MRMRKVYFYVVLTDVWIDPSEDIFVLVKEYHILVDDEMAVVLSEGTACVHNCFGIV